MLGLCLLGLLTNCSQRAVLTTTESAVSNDENTLTIWWERGYYAQEDEAIKTTIAKWEAETGKTVEISFLDQDAVLKQTENAIALGQIPDIVLSQESEHSPIPKWAAQGVLADVSDIIEPIRSDLDGDALRSVEFSFAGAKTPIAYAVPLKKQTIHIHYWRDLLSEAGLNEADIPTEWDAFWDFWQQAHDNLRAQGKTDVYGLGLPMSKEASDTYGAFHQVLEAYDIQLIDEAGNLLIDNAETREKLAAALDWYTRYYREGFVPAEAADWTDSDNNVAFLNRNLVMTVNPTLSIPGSQRNDEDVYFSQIATIEFPNEPDGEAPTYLTNTLQVFVLEAAPQREMAKEFIAYLIQPENLAPYLEGSLGRYFPVSKELAQMPFWNDPTDPHVFAGATQFKTGDTRPSYYTFNPAYSGVSINNVWGQAIENIVIDGASPQTAADTAIASIQEIFESWE